MLRSVAAKTLWERRWGLLGWVAGGFVVTGFVVAVYPIVRDSSGLAKLVDEMPMELLALVGIDPEIFTTGFGYLQAQMYTLIAPLFILVLAIGMGASATSTEEHTGTSDLLLTTPVTRSSVVLQKTLALTVAATLLILSFVAALLLGQVTVDLRLSIWGVIGVNLGLLLLGTFFGSMAFAIAAWTGAKGLAMGLTSGVAGLAFFINGMAPLVEGLQGFQGFLPFYWYAANDPLMNGPTAWHLLLFCGTALFTIVAVAGFNRRDIGVRPTFLRMPRRPAEAAIARSSQSRLLRSISGKTVWDRRHSFWWWLVGMCSIAVLTAVFFPLIEDVGGDALVQLVDSYPPEILAMFGMTDPASLFTGAGLMSTRVYSGIGLIVVLAFAIGMGKAALAGEEHEGTADLLLTTSRRRDDVVLGKSSAIFGLLAALVVGVGMVVWLANLIVGLSLTFAGLLTATVGMTLFGFLFAALALAAGAWTGSPGAATGIAVATGVVAFLLNGFGTIVDWLKPLRPLSPFYWYQGDANPLDQRLGWQQPLLLFIGLGLIAAAMLLFRRRDVGA
ncbi:MAG TPA: ABC transporter permease subunit [Acidimicrobiia bacterium]|nr:ABC transporter permease subunit [Acidimicrobiia bacterium]